MAAFKVYDPTTGQYVEKEVEGMAQEAAQPVVQAVQEAAQPVVQAVQQAAQPVVQAVQPVVQAVQFIPVNGVLRQVSFDRPTAYVEYNGKMWPII